MNIGGLVINKLQLIGIVVLLVGLAVGIYLVQQRQIFKPKAATNLGEVFNVTDDQGNALTCDWTQNPPTCTTHSLNIKINLKPGGLDALQK